MDRPLISNREWRKVARTAVILGARLRPDGTPSPALQRRVLFGCDLYHRGEVGRVLMSGGPTAQNQTEAEWMAGQAQTLGLPVDAVIVESRALNTRENARYSCALLLQQQEINPKDVDPANQPPTCVVITDLYHLPRAWLAFRIIGRHSGLRFRFLPCPAPDGLLRRPGYWRAALREIPAYAVDLFRCWLVPPPHPTHPSARPTNRSPR